MLINTNVCLPLTRLLNLRRLKSDLPHARRRLCKIQSQIFALQLDITRSAPDQWLYNIFWFIRLWHTRQKVLRPQTKRKLFAPQLSNERQVATGCIVIVNRTKSLVGPQCFSRNRQPLNHNKCHQSVNFFACSHVKSLSQFSLSHTRTM